MATTDRQILTDKYQIPYFNACIMAFGKRYGIETKAAYQYLRRFKALDFLLDFYKIEHTLSIEDAVDDMTVICKNNGGLLQ